MGSPHVYTLESGIPGILNYHFHDSLNAKLSFYINTAHGPECPGDSKSKGSFVSKGLLTVKDTNEKVDSIFKN